MVAGAASASAAAATAASVAAAVSVAIVAAPAATVTSQSSAGVRAFRSAAAGDATAVLPPWGATAAVSKNSPGASVSAGEASSMRSGDKAAVVSAAAWYLSSSADADVPAAVGGSLPCRASGGLLLPPVAIAAVGCAAGGGTGAWIFSSPFAAMNLAVAAPGSTSRGSVMSCEPQQSHHKQA